MSAYLPDINLNIQNYGVDSDQIDRMAARVGDMLANTKWAFTLLYLSFKASDVMIDYIAAVLRYSMKLLSVESDVKDKPNK